MAEAEKKQWSLDSEGNERRIVADSWYIGETLGKGGFGFVKMGYHKKNGKPFALKFIRKADSEDPQAKQQAALVATEINCLIRVQNPYVLKLFAYRTSCIYPQQSGEQLNTIMLVLELARGGDLFDILFYTKKLKLKLARTYFYQLAEGLTAIHAAGICHRDLKPQNLLLNSKFELKITDFGLSKIFEDKNAKKVMKTYYAGTQGYQAPEQILKRNFTPKCDVFSCGVILFILITGYPPCHNAHYSDPFYKYIAQVQYDKFWLKHRLNKTFDEPTRDVMNKTLCYQPTDRFSAKQMLDHEWTQNKKERMDANELQSTMKVLFKQAMEKKAKDDKKVEKLKGASKLGRDITEFGEIPLWGVDRVLPLGRSYALRESEGGSKEKLDEVEKAFKARFKEIERSEKDDNEKAHLKEIEKARRDSEIQKARENETARNFLIYLENLIYEKKGDTQFYPDILQLTMKVKLANQSETVTRDDRAHVNVYKMEKTGVLFALFDFPENFNRHENEEVLYEVMAGDRFPRWFRKNVDKEMREHLHSSALQHMQNNNGVLSDEFKAAVMNNYGCDENQYNKFAEMCVGTPIEFELPTMSEWLIPRCGDYLDFQQSLSNAEFDEGEANYDDLSDFFKDFNQQDPEYQPKKERDVPTVETHGYVLAEDAEKLPLVG